MATIQLRGETINTNGSLPQIGSNLPDFTLVKNDLSRVSLSDFKNKKLVLNIFPSVDTGTCAASVRQFNKLASTLPNVSVLCISRDLPFALKRFCGAEGLENVIPASDFNTGKFGKDYGLEMTSGKMAGLHSRVVIVADENGKILHAQQVPELTHEPDYESALESLK